ncbi:MAG TPA: fibronectin type III domain-containing protein [Flavobacteriales bacterium]|nr:fibronectin type III domain-containing protein [Flavobacteriales bacterium]
MARVKKGVSGLSPKDLAVKAQAIHDGLDGNANFPTPLPALDAYQSHIDALVAANAIWEAERSRPAFTQRRAAGLQVLDDVAQLAGYVQMASDGDEDKILSSNFTVVKRGTRKGELPPPRNLGAFLTNRTGRVALRWKRQDGADMHHVFMSTSAEPFNWQLIGATSKSRFDADSLEPGTFYFFAVSALGAAGESSKSEPCRAMAAA